ncbi:MAG: hypothetical protein IKE65_06605 [Clostridia bacterium]|nr:hypothetical protein [Clostridia bacterium]
MKRIMSMILVAVLLLGMVSSAFFVRAATGKQLINMNCGDTFITGIYPQSLVEDEALIDTLNAQAVNMYPYGFAYGVNNEVGGIEITEGLSYPKVKGLVDMSYGDVILGDAKYRKVVVNQMRPKSIDNDTAPGTGEMCGTYYFKWEPIEWIVVEKYSESPYKETHVRCICKNILDYGYLSAETAEEHTDFTSKELEELGFCRSEINGFYNWNLHIQYFSSFYSNAAEKLADFSSLLSSAEHGFEAPVSAYAQLMGADERFADVSQRADAYAPWNASTQTLVTQEGEFVDLTTQTKERVSDKSFRPMCDFRGKYTPNAQTIDVYPTEHEHEYYRLCYAPEALIEPAWCKAREKYAKFCVLCGCFNEEATYYAPTKPAGYFEHTPVKICSVRARRGACNGSLPATYYYTCSTCDSVLKDRYFKFTGECQTHEYYFSKSESSASCTEPGTAVWRCYNCYYDVIYEESEEPLGHDLNMENYLYKKTRTNANCTYNRTYYKVYACRRCGAECTDYEHYYEEEGTMNPSAHVFSRVLEEIPPTCTSPGMTEYACLYCESTNTVAVAPLGHDSNGTAQSGYSLISPATCTQDAVYYRTCTRCCKAAEQSYTAVGTALGHHYTKKDMKAAAMRTPQSATEPATYYYSCINCGEVLRDDEKYFSEEEYQPYLRNQVEAGGTVCFGSWPQSAVTDEALLSRLNEQAVTMQSYKYRYTSTYGSYYNYVNMRYGDVTLDGERYRKVTIGSYRSADLLTVPGVQGIHYQELNNYTQGGTYWFKWEPLVWRVQRIENDKAVLVCENVIDARNYLEDYSLLYNTTWSNSTLRQWLNDRFYESAFNDSEQEQVLSGELCTLDNFAYGTSGGAVTQDKIFVPALEDMQDVSLSINLPAAGTDYALAQGLCTINAAAVPWVSRTPSYNQSNLVYVNASGVAAEDEAGSISAVWGVRPMLRVSLLAGYKSEDVNEDGVVDLADISLLLQYFGAQSGFNTMWDINDNACIDIGDVSMILRSGYYGKKR